MFADDTKIFTDTSRNKMAQELQMFVLKLVLFVVFGTAAVAAVNAPYCRCNDQPLTSTPLTTTPVTSPSSPPPPPPDPCSGVECQNGGSCESDRDTFLCVCTFGYEGEFCQDGILLTSCGSVDCNRGRCVEQDGVARCDCREGVTGEFCQNDLCLFVFCGVFSGRPNRCTLNSQNLQDNRDPFFCDCSQGDNFPDSRFCQAGNCLTQPSGFCQNGGTCVGDTVVANLTCLCAEGYSGVMCELGPCPDNIVCENGGRCVIVNGEFNSCRCPRGTFGDRCEIFECLRICLNGGTCTVVDRSSRHEECICPPRIDGFDCEINTPLCDNVNCNRGECVVAERATVARCKCKPGATGEFCENDLCLSVNCGDSIECEVRSQYIQDNRDPVRCNCSLPGAQFCQGDTCLNQPSSFCQNRGTCVGDSVGNRGCLCAEGFSGNMCEVGPCPDDIVCENGGVCVIVNGEFNRCRCSEGYYGDRCELVGCKDGGQGDCQNQATCQFFDGREVCFCSEGFKGVFCELGPCFGVTCLNGGTCEEGYPSSFDCNCPLGFSNYFCEDTFCTGKCLNGQCILHLVETDRPFDNEVDGDTECVCSAGDTNPLCELCIDVDCRNGGTCITDNGIAECVCPDGVFGEFCENRNPIEDPCAIHVCGVGATCIREGGDNVTCQCRNGFSGQFCEDDPCRFPFCGNGTCVVNESGEPLCVCLEGYFGDRCQIYADCPEVLADICLNGGTCLINENFGRGFERCLCQARYAGVFCEHEPCINYPCQNGAPCIIVDDMPKCVCPDGLAGDFCDLEPCINYPCQNGAPCIIVDDRPKCVCPDGLGGDFCDLVVCRNGGQGDCQNGATCDLVDGEEICTCPPGIRGQFCELIGCQNGLQGDCLNGGTCDFLEGDGEFCICQNGYFGQFCELDECSGVNCNGASCANGICFCPFESIFGEFCQREAPNECDDPRTCLNGQCVNVGGEAVCSCLEGDTNPFCFNCIDTDCQNGGTCIPPETAGSFETCLCTEGFSGSRCDVSICSNLLDPCGRRGTCIVEGDNTFSCVCAEGVLGEFCEDDPCNTHVECVDGTCAVGADGAAFCDCNERAIGERCEENPCCCPELNTDCNSGTCVRIPDIPFYVCVCPEGLSGELCDIEECPNNSSFAGVCQNGGTCFSHISTSFNGRISIGDFDHCDCPEGYVGRFCNHAPCEHTPCLNDSSCIVEREQAVCVCRDGFEGRFCEQVVSR